MTSALLLTVLAVLPAAQQEDLLVEAVEALHEAFSDVQAALSLVDCSPACEEVITAKAAKVKQTSSFFIYSY